MKVIIEIEDGKKSVQMQGADLTPETLKFVIAYLLNVKQSMEEMNKVKSIFNPFK